MTASQPGVGVGAEPVDLTTCDREPIHLISAIQPAGFLITISTDWLISRVSANACDFLGRSTDALLGSKLTEAIASEAVHTLRNRLAMLRGEDAVERVFGLQLLPDGPRLDVAVHMSNGEIVFEFEPSEGAGELNAATMVRSMLGRLNRITDVGDLLREAARQIRALTGHDRVMIYRFHPDGSGEVVAERTQGDIEPFLGLRYPASDIPQQARALMVRNIVRVAADIDAKPVAIVPMLGPTGAALDLSMSTLRAHSPIHVEYLKNMGVRATLTISLLREGRLWGLIACHHKAPRPVSYERRTTAELFAHVLSLAIETREREATAAYEQRARQLHDRLMASFVKRGPTAENLTWLANEMVDVVPCDGVAVRVADDITLTGATPSREEVSALTSFLNQTAASQIFATNNLGQVHPAARDYSERAAGVLVIPISRVPRDYLMFFRREVAQLVNWAGDPAKPVELGPNGVRLTPRKSFEAWREIVRGQCSPWSEPELRAAGALRVTLLEVILQLTANAEHERSAARDRQDLLISELNHRVRNILGLIGALISQSKGGATDIQSFASSIGDRVQALARAHDQIAEVQWVAKPLATLIETEASAYMNDGGHRVDIEGPSVSLAPEAFVTMALLIHEMITNAAKYGALCNRTGRVAIKWTLESTGDLTVDWRESGGPPVQAPTRRGFGTTIIERSVPHNLNGDASIRYEFLGVRAKFRIPAKFVEVNQEIARPSVAVVIPSTGFRLAGTVLLLEDNMLIALDAEETLLSLGATCVRVANNVHEAMRLLDLESPAFALLDINLGEETSLPVADRLRASGIPYAFATGYGDGIELPIEHRNCVILKKPYTSEGILSSAAKAIQS